jgi:lipopolysaccharide transport system permease protein
MIAGLRLLFTYRSFLWATTLHDLRGRYAGTTFGMAWSVLYPLLFLGLYTVVYTMILKIRLEQFSTFDYVLLIFSGLIPFLGFSETLGLGVSAVTANKGLVKNTLFPIELIPVKAVLVGSMTMVIGLLVLQSILFVRGVWHMSQALVPIILVLQLLFTTGIIWILSALNVFFQDISQAVPIIMLFLMLVSPIGYTVDMIPKELMVLMYPNPLYYLIMIYRECIIFGRIPLVHFVIFFAVSWGIFWVGFYVFSRLKAVFADYV